MARVIITGSHPSVTRAGLISFLFCARILYRIFPTSPFLLNLSKHLFLEMSAASFVCLCFERGCKLNQPLLSSLTSSSGVRYRKDKIDSMISTVYYLVKPPSYRSLSAIVLTQNRKLNPRIMSSSNGIPST